MFIFQIQLYSLPFGNQTWPFEVPCKSRFHWKIMHNYGGFSSHFDYWMVRKRKAYRSSFAWPMNSAPQHVDSARHVPAMPYFFSAMHKVGPGPITYGRLWKTMMIHSSHAPCMEDSPTFGPTYSIRISQVNVPTYSIHEAAGLRSFPLHMPCTLMYFGWTQIENNGQKTLSECNWWCQES